MTPTEFLAACTELLGQQYVIVAPTELEKYCIDWSGRYRGNALAVLRPKNTQEVAAIVKLCRTAQIAIVPQGGNTGLSGGATPDSHLPSIILQMGRINAVRAIDPVNQTMVVEAGVLLADAQQLARQAGCLLPLSLASEGSCMIGGNLATNAGGTAVLRYGNMRQLCLGIEAVLPNGEIWDGLRALRKDNSGYALKDLLIGSEGTLAVITAAVLQLFPLPATRATCLVSVADVDSALAALPTARRMLDEKLSAFEIISPAALEAVAALMPEVRIPVERPYPWILLVETSSARAEETDAARLQESMQSWLGTVIESGVALNAVVAVSDRQAADMWAVRESVPLAQARAGFALRYDLSLPISALANFLVECETQLSKSWPEVGTVVFGHVGDGNLHFNLRPRSLATEQRMCDERAEIDRLVYDLVMNNGGSISAEHGIGSAKSTELVARKSAVEMAMMRALKQTFDPENRMNPGKLLHPISPQSELK